MKLRSLLPRRPGQLPATGMQSETPVPDDHDDLIDELWERLPTPTELDVILRRIP